MARWGPAQARCPQARAVSKSLGPVGVGLAFCPSRSGGDWGWLSTVLVGGGGSLGQSGGRRREPGAQAHWGQLEALAGQSPQGGRGGRGSECCPGPCRRGGQGIPQLLGAEGPQSFSLKGRGSLNPCPAPGTWGRGGRALSDRSGQGGGQGPGPAWPPSLSSSPPQLPDLGHHPLQASVSPSAKWNK